MTLNRAGLLLSMIIRSNKIGKLSGRRSLILWKMYVHTAIVEGRIQVHGTLGDNVFAMDHKVAF